MSGPTWEIIRRKGWLWRGWWVLRKLPTSSNGQFVVYECTSVARCWTRRGALRWYKHNVDPRR